MDCKIEENYITFGKYKIHVIVDNDNKIWFSARGIALLLGYKDPQKTIRRYVDDSYKKTYEELSEFTTIIKHAYTMYISENGLYKLFMTSKLKRAQKFQKWVLEEVLPSIRGRKLYTIKDSHEKEIKNMMAKIDSLTKNNISMKHDLKPEKFPEGGVVYAVIYSENGKEAYKIGKTTDLKKRKSAYNSHSFHKKELVIKMETPYPSQLETIIKGSLESYRYKDKKDVYICSLNILEKIFNDSNKHLKKIKKYEDMQGGGEELKTKIKTLKKEIRMIDKLLMINSPDIYKFYKRLSKLVNNE